MEQSQKAPSEGLAVSPSVEQAIVPFLSEGQIRAWQIVQNLLSAHPEYGGQMASKLVTSSGPSTGETREAIEWIRAVRQLFRIDRVPELHGRLAILGLTLLDINLRDYLALYGFIDALKGELKERFEELLRAEPDRAPLHLDNPSQEDHLGRKGFAQGIAIRLTRVWDEYNKSDQPKIKGSYMVHIYGPWGAGKTSLLNLLHQELQLKKNAKDAVSRWVVVEFNAWQQQRIDPPWWSLMDTVFRRAVEQLARNGELGRARMLQLREWWWRIRTGRSETLIALIVSLLALATVIIIFGFDALTQVGGNAQSVSAIIALVSTIWSAFLVFSRSLVSGSARAAQAFMQNASDPMEKIYRHFQDLVGWVEQPIVIFIDDLDRCQTNYVVGLLEGIQTLFNDSRVVYVIAADRRWIYICFEQTYVRFADVVQEPGRRLGSLFLEKAFELSVPVPHMSPEVKKAYWDYLIRGEQSDMKQKMESEIQSARDEFQNLTTEQQILEQLSVQSDDPIHEQARRGAAIQRLAQENVEASTEYFLKSFAHLLEPNPRAMKRLVNAYALERDLALLTQGPDVLLNLEKRKQLALWTILSLRWPLLEEYLEEQPERVEWINNNQNDKIFESLRSLAENSEVRELINGGGVGSKLDANTIRELTSLAGFKESKTQTPIKAA